MKKSFRDNDSIQNTWTENTKISVVQSLDTKPQIPTNRLPNHIAIIMDGNNRWAKRNNLTNIAGGHRAGVQNIRDIIECCTDYNINILSLFAFSSENWRRPQEEIQALMELFLFTLRHEVKKLHKNNIKIKIIGDISGFNNKIRNNIKKAESLTAKNSGIILIVAANYGGKWDLTNAMQQIAKKVQKGIMKLEDINDKNIQKHLSTNDIPPPDLLIRTSGEHRISNFMLWQCAYTELYFTDILWPDFDKKEFYQALLAYSSRKRRFGKTSK